MGLQFIRSDASMDMSERLADMAQAWLDADAAHQVFYLVPNYMNFESELQTLRRLKKRTQPDAVSFSTTRLQVFTFRRLAWYYLQHTTEYSGKILSHAGAAMIFRQLLTEYETELTVFRGEVEKTGFIQQLFTLYQEMRDADLSIEDFVAALSTEASGGKNQDLKRKGQDLQLLFSAFEKRVAGFGLRDTEILTDLHVFLADASLSHVMFIIQGYTQFSEKELQLLTLFLMRGGETKIALTLDQSYATSRPDPMDLFYETGETYHQLYQLARANQVPVLTDFVEKDYSLTQSDALRTLLKRWIKPARNTPTLSPVQDVQLWQAENPKEEVAQIAKEIRRLVIEEGYRYREIQLLTRQVADYQRLVPPIFARHDIPVTIDQEISMAQHPIVEWMQALFAMAQFGFRSKDVLRFLKTELFLPMIETEDLAEWKKQRDRWRDKIDQTENVVLAYGFEHHMWQQASDWQFAVYAFDEVMPEEVTQVAKVANEVRKWVQQLVPPFFQAMTKAVSGLEGAQLFYQFLIKSGVEKQLRLWRNQAIAVGDLEQARNHEQTWQEFMRLLDEYVVIYGEQAFDFDVFQLIFSSGLEGLTYHKVPAVIDQVQVRSFDVARPGQAKIIFGLGLTDQVLPQTYEELPLFSVEEREMINAQFADGRTLLQHARRKMMKEPFQAYLFFSAASERLYLSYPSTNDAVKEVKISPYLTRVQQQLGLPLQYKHELTIADDEATSLQQISTYEHLVGTLVSLQRQKRETQQPLLPFWEAMTALLQANSEKSAPMMRVFDSLTHRNVPAALTVETASQLYGQRIHTSVSKIESFFHCQYQYFSRFGLRLKERSLFQLTTAAMGEFFHAALDQFFKALLTKEQSLAQLSDAQVAELAEQVLQQTLTEERFAIFTTSARMQYIRYQLMQTIKKVSWALKQQSERSQMTPVQTEILFGQVAQTHGISGLHLPLANGGELAVRGKIDRLDQLVTEKGTYISVVDYKSSHRKFRLSEAYYGLAMQMLTYLDVASKDALQLIGEAAQPAGALYLHVQNPILSYEQAQKDEQLLKQYQFDGLLLNDSFFLEQLDRSLLPKESSVVYPIAQNVKEQIKPGRRQEDKFVTEEELACLLRHNRQKLTEAGNTMLSGNIALNPAYQGKERLACRYCPFRSVCNFDVMLEENHYHRIEALTKEEVLERLSAEEGEGLDA